MSPEHAATLPSPAEIVAGRGAQWQPISTAPRDRWIELFRPSHPLGPSDVVVLAIYDPIEDAYVWPSGGGYDPIDYAADAHDRIKNGTYYRDNRFTHWREHIRPAPASEAPPQGRPAARTSDTDPGEDPQQTNPREDQSK